MNKMTIIKSLKQNYGILQLKLIKFSVFNYAQSLNVPEQSPAVPTERLSEAPAAATRAAMQDNSRKSQMTDTGLAPLCATIPVTT